MHDRLAALARDGRKREHRCNCRQDCRWTGTADTPPAACTGAALRASDMDAYRIYNRDLHAAITEAARNTCLSSAMGQLTLQKAEAQALIERHILGALGDIVCFGLSAPA